MTINTLLTDIKQQLVEANYPQNEARAIVHILCKHYLNLNSAQLYISLEQPLNETEISNILNAVKALVQHQPLQYILGETEFYRLPFFVNENVLIPRPETEEIVQWIINDLKGKSPSILDIGTGSGCIAVSVAKNIPNSHVYALDISAGALKTAARNAEHNNVMVNFVQQDILKTDIILPQKFDCIVSNPPYIRNSEKPLINANVLDYEPHTALFVDDNNPLIFYDAVARVAKEYLLIQGVVYVEINEALPNETQAIFQAYGFETSLRNDINNKPRMIKAWIKA